MLGKDVGCSSFQTHGEQNEIDLIAVEIQPFLFYASMQED